VVAGRLAKSLLATIGIAIVSHVIRIGEAATSGTRPVPEDLDAVDDSEVRCFDASAEEAMISEIKAAAKVGDSLGGIIEVIAYGVPVGLGSHVHWDRKLDGLLAGALMSIQAVKAVEIGDGMTQASQRGSVAHDAIAADSSHLIGGGYIRRSDHAGGLEGGISSGAPLIAKVAMKPLSTLNRPVLETVDLATGESTISFKERTDVTAVPALGVVAEAMMAIVVANEALRKFGGDSVEEFVRNHDAYVAHLGSTASAAPSE
jgi:chorismate synthase